MRQKKLPVIKDIVLFTLPGKGICKTELSLRIGAPILVNILVAAGSSL
jgi:hypothetical protein